MNIETHEVIFSSDQTNKMGLHVTEVLQQVLSQARTSTGKRLTQTSHYVLVIDALRERRHYLESVITLSGYHCRAFATTLDAYTLFLQSGFLPFAIVLGQLDTNYRFFLNRLLQQIQPRCDWAIHLLHLRAQFSQTPSMKKKLPPGNPSIQESKARERPGLHTPSTTVPLSPQWEPGTRIQQPALKPGSSGPLPPPNSQPLPNFMITSPLTREISSQNAPVTENLVDAPPTTLPLTPLPPAIKSGPLPTMQKVAPLSPGQMRKENKPTKTEKISLNGQDIGRYQIISLLGGMFAANTYLAYDRLREQEIALKAVQVDSTPYHLMEGAIDENNFFQHEMLMHEKLKHPHLLPVLNCSSSYISGTSFIYKTMQYFPEETLAHWFYEHSNTQPYTLRETMPLITQIGDVLQYLHDRQVVYQNFKLTNLLLSTKAESLFTLKVVLTDLSPVQDGSLFSKTAEAYPYLAPERWMGMAPPASDQYALAVFIYKLLTGRLPFQGSSEHTMKHLHLNMQPQPPGVFNATLPPPVNNIILRALAKRPEERFPSVMNFIQALWHHSK
jgi:hypothetical protein